MDNFNRAIVAEKEKKYNLAIELYLLSSLEEGEQHTTYYRMALLFNKMKMYREACESFLMIHHEVFSLDQNILKVNKEELHQYFVENQLSKVSEWLTFLRKAKELKQWNVVSYIYKELLARAEIFSLDDYYELAKSLMQEKKYKEAYKYFKEGRLREEDSTKGILLEERIILFEFNENISNRPLELYEDLKKDAHFDAYRFVFAIEKVETFSKVLDPINSLIIQQNTQLHKRYLARSKYVISNTSPSDGYVRKPAQVYLWTEIENSPSLATHHILESQTNYSIIEEVFFRNSNVASNVVTGDDSLGLLYQKALDLFDKEDYASAYKTFLSVSRKAKDLKRVLPTTYYLAESKLQVDLKKGEKIENLLVYKQYKFTAANFAGIQYLLDQAIVNSSENSAQWKELQTSFLDILSDIKKNNTINIRTIGDQVFLNKIVVLSKYFDNNLEADKLPYQVWFVFSNLFVFARLYKKYYLTREKAIESLLSLTEVTDINLLRYQLNVYSEKEKHDNYSLLRERLLENKSEYIKKELQLLGSSELYFNQQLSASEFYKPFYSAEEKEFAKYIENKTIAIVGPVDSKLKLGSEIDSHDVVIRFNYKGIDQSICEGTGANTNVSLYISEILIKDRMLREKIFEMNKLDWLIYDKANKKESVCFVGFIKKMRSVYYSADAFANPYVKGTPSAIQRTLLDLLRFKVGKIKIYNSNLFLNNKYDNNYKSRASLGADHLNFIWHDPVSNFIFLKRLKKFDIIDTDEVLSKILEQSADEYIDALEVRYGREDTEETTLCL